MEAKLFSKWATAYCLKTQCCEKLFNDTIQFLREENSFNDSFFYLIVKVIRMIISEGGNDANGLGKKFLIFLMLSSDISEAQLVTLINLARESLPTLNLFWSLRQRLIDIVSLMIDEKITEKKQIICVLQLLVSNRILYFGSNHFVLFSIISFLIFMFGNNRIFFYPE